MEEINQEKKSFKTEMTQKYIPFIWEFAKIAIIAFIIVAPIRYFLFQPFIVKGESMTPNLQDGNYLIIDEISYRFAEPQRGDVIVFNAGFIPGYAGQRFVKRLIGLPGETIEITNGAVQITKDGKTTILSEKYLPDSLKTYGSSNGYNLSLSPERVTLKSDQYFVLGDNRNGSYDSRMWGVVMKQNIIGKASLRLLPINSLSEISRPTY
ncbi:MAG: signal peptidase I [Candidatus Staskawiczbacteria bacterium]|nr:signal peptidase I [Candidatus Staskawiczbacteria bacterium]